MASLPTVVLVHGAWHVPSNYQDYKQALEKQGFQVYCPQLPFSRKESPTDSLPEDIACVKELVTSLVDDGQRVLMIMHSYGGAVGGSAVDGLSFAERKAAGQPGGVIHLLYLCAYVYPIGVSIQDIITEAGAAELLPLFMDETADGRIFPKDPGPLFFSGRADQKTIDKALSTLVTVPQSLFLEKSTGAAWKTIPATYVRTSLDNCVLPGFQEIMLAKVKDAGVEMRIEDHEADHSLFITEQEEMVRAAVRAAEDERNAV